VNNASNVNDVIEVYVLDSFALIAHLEDEARGVKVTKILKKAQQLKIIEADMDLTLKAAKLKSKYPVAYADCFAASLAVKKDAKVITGDPEFREMEDEVKVEWI